MFLGAPGVIDHSSSTTIFEAFPGMIADLITGVNLVLFIFQHYDLSLSTRPHGTASLRSPTIDHSCVDLASQNSLTYYSVLTQIGYSACWIIPQLSYLAFGASISDPSIP